MGNFTTGKGKLGSIGKLSYLFLSLKYICQDYTMENKKMELMAT